MPKDHAPRPEEDGPEAGLRAALEAAGISQAAAAKQIGISSPALSQWLNGRYGGDVDAVADKVRKWLASRGDAVAAPKLRRIDFQRTETAERLWAMFQQAQHVPSIVVCAGAPGIGKTTTARAYRAANPNVWLATLDTMTTSPAQVLAEIADVMNLKVGSHATLRNRIGERLEGTGGLLIIDESQNMPPRSLEMARALFDRYGVGIVLMGNEGLFAATSLPSKAHGLAQFFGRVQRRTKFAQVSEADVAVILDAYGIRDPEQRRFLSLIAAKPQGLRGVNNVLFEAQTLALGEDAALGIRHMKLAWQMLNHFDGAA